MAKVSKTTKLRQLVAQQIKRMEKRGFSIDDAIREKLKTGKYQTLESYRRKGYKKLYEQATYKIDGKTVTGTRGRIEERKRATEKAKHTIQEKRYKESFKDIEGQFDPETGEIYDSYYRSEDVMPQEDVEESILARLYEFIEKLEQPVSDYFYDIDGRKRYYSNAAKDQIMKAHAFLRNLLDREISNGRAKEIAQTFQDNAEEISSAFDRLHGYYERDISSAMYYLASLITNRTLSLSELSTLDTSEEMITGYEET